MFPFTWRTKTDEWIEQITKKESELESTFDEKEVVVW